MTFEQHSENLRKSSENGRKSSEIVKMFITSLHGRGFKSTRLHDFVSKSTHVQFQTVHTKTIDPFSVLLRHGRDVPVIWTR